MTDTPGRHTGGCLCGALRYEADGVPTAMGYCMCGDCRKASGSGFIPFMGFPATAFSVMGPAKHVIARNNFRGTDSVRNICPECGSLVFGGIVGKDEVHTIYAGSLDDASLIKPTMAIFMRDKQDWVVLPPGIAMYETLPVTT